MKKLLPFFLMAVIASCSTPKYLECPKSISIVFNADSLPPAKTVKPPKVRYWFVGYYINNGRQSTSGNVQWHIHDGLPPKKKEVYEFLKKHLEGKIQFSFLELTITGLHEFKSYAESMSFNSNQ